MFRNGFVFRLIAALIFVGVLAAGGFMAYKAGVAQGVAEAPAVATAISEAAENGQGFSMYGPGFAHPYAYGYRHHFGFFPGGICLGIFFLFFALGFMKMVFFRGMRGRHGHHGPWNRNWEGGVPPMFEKWHKYAHGESEEAGNEPEENSETKT